MEVSGKMKALQIGEKPGYNPAYTGGSESIIPQHEEQSRESLNMNILYLESIHALINQYVIAAFKGDVETSLGALALLGELMAPKIDTQDNLDAIELLEDEFAAAAIKDANGELSRVNPLKVREVRKKVRVQFVALLRKLELKGMLTFIPKDFKTVMGDFSRS